MRAEPAAALDQERNHPGDIFPAPPDGATVESTPPAFWWRPADGVAAYRVVIEDARGAIALDQTTATNLLVPRRPLPPGAYRWDVIAGQRRRGWWRFTVPAAAPVRIVPTADDVIARLPATRPRHLYLPEDLAGLVERHPQQVAALRRTIALALSRPLPPRPRYHRDPSAPLFREALGEHRASVDRDLVACALGHLLLRDAAAGARAKSALLEICDWNPAGPCAVDSAWGDEIGLSNARCLPAVFDWIHDLLDERERGFVAETIAQYARQVVRRLADERFTARPGNSHLGRLPGYLGTAAMVLHGYAPDAEVRAWLDQALDLCGSFHPFYGDADGGWAEGTFYATSYAKWPLPFFLALERVTGFSFLDHRPFWRHVSQFFLHFAAPSWEIHPFGDGYWCRAEDAEWPGFFAQDPFSVFADRFGPEEARALAAAQPAPAVYHLHLFDVFRTPAARGDGAGPATPSRVFAGAGFVSMHSAIGRPTVDTALLARASRFGTYSHQHGDQGSFAIISRDRGLITPTGYFGNSYGTRHHVDWTRTTRAHNCLLVDGAGQAIGSHRAVGRIEWLRDDGALVLTSLDLSAAYPTLTGYRRRLLFLRPGLILVHDEVRAGRPVACDWLAHTLSPPRLDGVAVEVLRAPASLRATLFAAEGAIGGCRVSDRFEPDVNDGVPPHLHRPMPTQYHLAWSLPRAAGLRAAAVFAVDGVAVGTACVGGVLTVAAGGREIRCDLGSLASPAFVCDGVDLAAERLGDHTDP